MERFKFNRNKNFGQENIVKGRKSCVFLSPYVLQGESLVYSVLNRNYIKKSLFKPGKVVRF